MALPQLKGAAHLKVLHRLINEMSIMGKLSVEWVPAFVTALVRNVLGTPTIVGSMRTEKPHWLSWDLVHASFLIHLATRITGRTFNGGALRHSVHANFSR